MRGLLFMSIRNLILVDPIHIDSLKPLSWARPVASFRIGILRIFEKWEFALNCKVSFSVPEYLQEKFPLKIEEENILIQAHLLPSSDLAFIISKLAVGEFLVHGSQWVAANLNRDQTENFLTIKDFSAFKKQEVDSFLIRGIYNLWELFQWNAVELETDFKQLSNGRKSAAIDSSNRVIGNQIFVEEGAKISSSILNSTTGPIYIGRHAEIMEGCMIRGGLALCDSAQLKMGAKIYGATTIGPGSRIGGEVNNSVIQGNSNKAHDGFLGNSVLGEWCNIGADSNNSNLKNNYEAVKLWDYNAQRFIPTGTIFCGLIMGDHAKCGINTMFNTGTVVGYGANVFGDGFPRQFIPDFAWGGTAGFSTFQLAKFYQTANAVLQRRECTFDLQDQSIAEFIFMKTQFSRTWEKPS